MKLEAIIEAYFFYIQIQLQCLHLFGHCNFQHRVLVQRVAQETAQACHHGIGELCIPVKNQGGNGIQCIEQEVGVELRMQHFQLCLVGHGRGLQPPLLFLLRHHVKLDAEVQRTPHDHHHEGAGSAFEVRPELHLP